MRAGTIACAFVCLVGAPAVAQPVLRFTFDEAAGSAMDSGAAPLTVATLEGGATRSADTPSGSGLSLDLRTDGPYAHLLGTDDADLDGLAALTVTTWLKVEAYPTNLSNNKRLVAKQAAGAFGGFNFSMNATPNDGDVGADNFKIGMFLGNNISSGTDDFGFAFADVDVDAANKWVMLAVTYDGATGATKFYIGDVTTGVAQLGNEQFIVPMTVDGGDAPVGVGYTHAAPASDTSVTGWQDDVRVYNTALDLTALEAIRLENLGPGGGNPADFDGDQDVDGNDLAEWAMGFSTTGTATKADGDADLDMDVDGGDFLVWQQELGPAGGAAAIPEPAAGVLALLATLAGVTVRRRLL
jgi:hypothetical protein